MRLKNKKKYYISQYSTIEDEEGNVFDGWNDKKEFYATISPASGKVQAEIYGSRLQYINNMLINGKYTITLEDNKRVYNFDTFSISEGDGIYVYSNNKPDYKVISIKPFTHLQCEIEAIENGEI